MEKFSFVQKLLLKSLADTCLCNPLLVPPGDNEEMAQENDFQILAANLRIEPGTVKQLEKKDRKKYFLHFVFSLPVTNFGLIRFLYIRAFEI